MPSSATAELVRQLARARALHDERAASPDLAEQLDRLAAWQTRRLNATYADLASQARYAPAIVFFRTDLYSAGDFSRRDADLARVVPLMTRVLPEGVIATVASAMELSALSHELDRSMVAKLDVRAPLSATAYAEAFRALANRPVRERQIALIGEVGRALDRYVHKPMLFSTLIAMRRPARAAGLGALQAFLERGFSAFRNMHGAGEFLDTVEERETALINAIFAGGPVSLPSL
jgi:uncharacterized membrane protein YeiB